MRRSKLTRRKFISGSLLALAGVLVWDMFWFERYVLDWSVHVLPSAPKHPIRVLQISDLHMQQLGRRQRKIAEKINTQPPDLLVLTGDVIDEQRGLTALEEFLALLPKSLPKVAILGNWEYWGNVNLSQLKNLYSAYGVQLLINSHTQFTIKGRRVGILGVDDWVAGSPDWTKTTQDYVQQEVNLLLCHCPAFRDQVMAQASNFTLHALLAGHTHGGQLNFFGWTPFKPRGSGKYLSGWYTQGGYPMYVSKGIGTSILPLRFGARAEVVELQA